MTRHETNRKTKWSYTKVGPKSSKLEQEMKIIRAGVICTLVSRNNRNFLIFLVISRSGTVKGDSLYVMIGSMNYR